MKILKLITLALFIGISSLSYSQIVVKVKPIVRKPVAVLYATPRAKVVTYTTIAPRNRYVKGHWAKVHGRRVWIEPRYVRF